MNEEQKAQSVENVIESNPEQSQEVLNTIAPDNPITEEANQITDGNPNNVEVNNQQVEKGLDDLDIDELFNLIDNDFKNVKPVEDAGGFLNNERNNPLLESNEESVTTMPGEDKVIGQTDEGVVPGESGIENNAESNTMEQPDVQSQEIDFDNFLQEVEPASFATDLQDFYKKGYITDEDIKKAVNECAAKHDEIEKSKKEVESLPEEKKEITTKALDLIEKVQSQNTLKQSIKDSVKSKGIDWDKVHVYEPGEDPIDAKVGDYDERVEANNEYEYPEGVGNPGVLTEKDEDFAGPDELPAIYEKYGDIDPYRQLPAIYEEKGLVGVEEYIDNYPHEVEWAVEEIDREPGGEPLPEEEVEEEQEEETEFNPHEVDLNYTGSNVGKNKPFESEETKMPGVSGSAGKPGLLGNLGRLTSGGSVSSASPIKHDSPESKGTSVNRAHGNVLPDPNNQHSVVAGSHEMPQIGKSMFGGLGMMKPLHRSDMRIRVGESHLPEGHEGHTSPSQSAPAKGMGVSMPNISALTNAEELVKQLKFKHPRMPFEIRNGQVYLGGRKLTPEEINSLIK